MKSLKKNMTLNMTKTVMGLLFPIITFPYVSRVLEPVGVGKINFANSIISYFAMIAALGINTYGVREAAKIRDDKKKLTKFVKEILTINFISTFVAYLLLALTLLFVPKFYEYRTLLIVCSGSILFTTIGIDWLYSALEEFAYITIRSIIFQIISIILMFIFVKTHDDYLIYAAIGVISSVGSNILNFIHAHKYISFNDKVTKEIKKHIKPIFTLFAMSIAVSIYTALDTTMLGVIKGDEQVGIYTVATRINKLVVTVITAAVAVLLPRLSYFLSKHEEERFYTLSENSFKIIVMFALPSAVGLSLLAHPIIMLLSGAKFEMAIPTMRIMNPIIIVLSLSNLIGIQILMPLGKEKITLISVIIGAIVNFTLNIILIPKYGAFGAGCATVCAESLVTLFQLVCVRKLFNWKNIIIHSLQCGIATVLMSIVIYLLLKIEMQFFLQLIVTIFSGVIIYTACLLLIRNQFCISILKGRI